MVGCFQNYPYSPSLTTNKGPGITFRSPHSLPPYLRIDLSSGGRSRDLHNGGQGGLSRPAAELLGGV
jgi:hypothetical protein